MPRPTNLSSMSVDALLKLRDDINKVLNRKANELRSQLSMLGRPAIQRESCVVEPSVELRPFLRANWWRL